MSREDKNSDDILKRLFEPKPIKVRETLEELFDQKLNTLDIPKTTALKIMGMPTRTLNGILSGEQKVLDYTQLIKLANFLGIELEQVATLYLEKLQEVHKLGQDVNHTSEIVDFINDKFNLPELRKVGIIESLTDYDKIIDSICRYFGLKKIFDYKEPKMSITFSSGKKARKNCGVKNWIYIAEQTCIELRNPNTYDREKLIEYFPQIRWHSMDVEGGLVKVINHLFQLGVTVVLIPSFPSLHIRGATFSINDKPCIALTDYVGFYPTLWFALVHELYHVLFDWNEIQLSEYHISTEDKEYFDPVSQTENEADEFARQYLFSKEKTKEVGAFINEHNLVRKFTQTNHVDPSFAYVFYAFDSPSTNKYAWGRAKKRNPKTGILKSKLENSFGSKTTFDDHIKKLRNTVYN